MTSTMLPAHKGEDRDNFGNFRTASVTSVLLKTFERCLSNRTVNNLGANKIMRVQQHGFGQKRSCPTNLISILHEKKVGLKGAKKYKSAIWTIRRPLFRETWASSPESEGIWMEANVGKWIAQSLKSRSQS